MIYLVDLNQNIVEEYVSRLQIVAPDIAGIEFGRGEQYRIDVSPTGTIFVSAPQGVSSIFYTGGELVINRPLSLIVREKVSDDIARQLAQLKRMRKNATRGGFDDSHS